MQTQTKPTHLESPMSFFIVGVLVGMPVMQIDTLKRWKYLCRIRSQNQSVKKLMHSCEHEWEYDNVHYQQAGALFGVRLVYFRDYCNVQIIVQAGLGDPFVCLSLDAFREVQVG